MESRAARPPRRDELFAARTLDAREKVAPQERVVCVTPANRRKCHAGFPCRRRHRKPSCALACMAVRAPCAPKATCTTSCLWRSFLTRGTSGADGLAPAPRRCHANLDRLSCHQLSPPEENAVAIRFPSLEGNGGLGNELLSVCSCSSCTIRWIIREKESLPHTEAACT